MGDPISIPAMVRVPHPELSLWQSAVAEARADRLAGGDVSSPLVHADPVAVAASEHALAVQAAAGLQPGRHPWFDAVLEVARRVHLEGVALGLEAVLDAAGSYTNRDPDFAGAILKFVGWYLLLHRPPTYRDWRRHREGLRFGAVEGRLPAGARIGVIGDWGTGLHDARALLERMLTHCRIDAIVHLGDVYYSGTPRETLCNFADVLDAAFRAVPPRLPVFDLAGNHDYYSGGNGFHERLDTLNAAPWRQAASYFRVATEDGRWQLVGVDTGVDDRTPGIVFNPAYRAPRLRDGEREWLHDKLDGFGGRTILLSHHQLFSAHARLNGPASGAPLPNVNGELGDAVRPYAGRIALWMWGHEHSLALYEDGQHGIAKCRLIGCSAFETEVTDRPYDVRFPDVRLRQPAVELSVVDGRYSHGFAVVDLGAASAEYYEVPAGPGAADASGPLEPLCIERL